MRVAIVHYHLGPGGVPRVIRAASAVLAEPGPADGPGWAAAGVPHVILAGEVPAEPAGMPLVVVPELRYQASFSESGARALAARLREAAGAFLGAPPDVWHFHNHSLGKNPLVTRAAVILACENERLVLQIHDLAEDGRPHLYQNLHRVPERYPVSPRIHYAFLNPRDHATFLAAGLPPGNASVLPNPVTHESPLPGASPDPAQPALFFAPVRGIRRKNLGEIVLLSILAPVDARFAVSRAPREAEAKRLHDLWQRFARLHAPRIQFDVTDRLAPAQGGGTDFMSWLRHATHIVGASVAEGFDLPLLEAAAWGKPFIGRRLGHLGRETPHARLYDRLLVPAAWIDRPMLRDHVRTAVERNHRAWRIKLAPGHADAVLDALWGDGWLDFGNLPEAIQQSLIERCARSEERAVPLVEAAGGRHGAAGWLVTAAALRRADVPAAALATFSPAACRCRLLTTYQNLADSPASAPWFPDPARILAPHLRPEAFHFLLSAPARPVRRHTRFRAILFDVYGTLLLAPPGAVRPDPAVDPVIAGIIRRFGHSPPPSPTRALHEAVRRHHAFATVDHPEVDLRVLWREILPEFPANRLDLLVIATEDVRVPTRPMPGAAAVVRRLAAAGVPLGLVSNAQCNTLHALGDIAPLFDPALTVLSYQHGVAKPSRALFELAAERLAARGIPPQECLFVGNDPAQDIAPAAAAGFATALFAGCEKPNGPETVRPDLTVRRWGELLAHT